jgi:hypothetical protein
MQQTILDRGLGLEHLELANRHVAAGQERLERQRRLVARLQDAGRDTDQALVFLSELEQTLALFTQTRNRLLSDLGMTSQF